MGTRRCFTKDLFKLMRTIDSVSDGQAKIVENTCCGEKELFEKIVVEIAPSDGLYKGGKFKFQITTLCWPTNAAPFVWCETPIYHPNINTEYKARDDTDNNVCVSLFNDWTYDCNFDDVIQALLVLFYEPNCDDPLSYCVRKENFEEDVRRSLKGGCINGIELEPNYGWLEGMPPKSMTSHKKYSFLSRLRRTNIVRQLIRKFMGKN